LDHQLRRECALTFIHNRPTCLLTLNFRILALLSAAAQLRLELLYMTEQIKHSWSAEGNTKGSFNPRLANSKWKCFAGQMSV